MKYAKFGPIFLIGILLGSLPINAQIDRGSQLFLTLKANDSLIFDIAFNTCKTERFQEVLSADFAFYHDQSGITPSYQDFVEGIKSGLCGGNVNSRRELEEASLEVFPLNDEGKLYGAIQQGVHRFYNQLPDGKETLGSTARFTHLWLLEGDSWKLSRVLSYDHK